MGPGKRRKRANKSSNGGKGSSGNISAKETSMWSTLENMDKRLSKSPRSLRTIFELLRPGSILSSRLKFVLFVITS